MPARRRAPSLLLATSLTLCAAACDPAAEAGPIALRPAPGGGILTDCAHIGGLELSQLETSAPGPARVRQVCLDPNVAPICSTLIKVSGGRLRVHHGAKIYQGDDLAGSRWEIDLDTPDPESGEGDGVVDSTLALVLTGRRLVASPSGPLELVDFSIDRGSVSGPLQAALPEGNGPLPLCEPDPLRGGATEAAVFGGLRVDQDDASFSASPGTLHVACTAAATGKAALLGYRPEAIGLGAFEAVIRAIRADYCGDNTSHAADDDPVLFADVKGIQASLGAAPEARWGSEGALCLGEARGLGVDAAAIRGACGIPTCGAGPLGSKGEWLVTSLP